MDEKSQSTNIFVWIIGMFFIGVAAGFGAWYWQQGKVDDLNKQINSLNTKIDSLEKTQDQNSGEAQEIGSYISPKGVRVKVFIPNMGETVTSPLIVMGEVPGSWSFEADFPIQLKDSSGKVIAEEPGQLQADWMTEELVPFIATLEFKDAEKGDATLILHKDNPSGLDENDDSVEIQLKI